MGEHISRAARPAKVATVLATGAIYKITGTSKIDFFASRTRNSVPSLLEVGKHDDTYMKFYSFLIFIVRGRSETSLNGIV